MCLIKYKSNKEWHSWFPRLQNCRHPTPGPKHSHHRHIWCVFLAIFPTDEGINAWSKALAESGHTSPPSQTLWPSWLNHVLTKNNFTFLDKHYLQIHGTAMGTRMAPFMACLFMGKLEERMPVRFGPMPTLHLVALYQRHILHLDPRPAPDSAFYVFFFCVHFTPD